MLTNSEEAESGEEYFTGNETTGLYRRYRPTRSERGARSEAGERNNNENPDAQAMEVDEIPSVTQEDGRWVEYDRNNPPADANWDDMDPILKYLPADEDRATRKVREAGIFTPGLLKEFLQCRISTLHGQKDPRAAFDHVLRWNDSEKRDFANFSVMVLSGQWEINWDESVRKYFEEGVA